MKLYPVTLSEKDNDYSGPAILSALTGLGTHATAAVLRELSGNASVMDTDERLMERALKRHGLTMELVVRRVTRPTLLSSWLRYTRPLRTPGRVFLVSAGGQWHAVSGQKFVNADTVEIVPVKHQMVQRSPRVAAVWEILPLEAPVFSDAET